MSKRLSCPEQLLDPMPCCSKRERREIEPSIEDDEDVNVTDVSDDDNSREPYPTAPVPPAPSPVDTSRERFTKLRSEESDKGSSEDCTEQLLSACGSGLIQCRPSVIKAKDILPPGAGDTDIDEHFRKSLSQVSVHQAPVDAAVDDHFARALGDIWWKLKVSPEKERPKSLPT